MMVLSKAKPGQSFTEYGLIGALVAIIAFGGLVALGNTITKSLNGMLPNAVEAPASGEDEGSSLVGAGKGSAPIVSNVSQQGEDPSNVCVSDGWCLDLKDIKKAEKATTQTTGANGMELVSSYAGVLKDIEARLEEMPDVDPTLREYISIAARAGHAIAVADSQSGDIKDESIAFIYRSDDLRSYLQQHPGALPSEVKQVIHKALANIQKLSVKEMQKTKPDYYDYFQIPPELRIAVDNDYDLANFAQKIHNNANVVCKSGKADKDCMQ